MELVAELIDLHAGGHTPFLINGERHLCLAEVVSGAGPDLTDIAPGEVVALIGDFDPVSILILLRLIERGVILVPLTAETRPWHSDFFETAGVDVAIENGAVRRLRTTPLRHPLLDAIRERGMPGLILFTSGTTGRPKAILHDFSRFLARYRTPRPALRTLSFLLFDHIGGINTLLHTLFNRGLVVVPDARTPSAVVNALHANAIELLPTTPTFLRLMLMSGLLETRPPTSLRLITYGTERMDAVTLERLCALLPAVDLRQTYGMSELGILRVVSRSRNSLWMRVGGEGVATRVVNGILHIRAESRMLGYLNAESPFDDEGWYDTHDRVEQDGPWLRIVGRDSEVISVGGVKFLPGEVERGALLHPEVLHAHARGVENPITGQHLELLCELRPEARATREDLRRHLIEHLPEALRPHRIRIGPVAIGHRFKRA
ncbi:ANL family adenylate-forming protein [Thiocystis violacea]|uniref:ANL family adenylate-forming protein n=1 Tax=Thiocystis violacea TaxID=13725 RepID=UPI001904FAE5|nr:fatty acid--CoA ligase family protein [Thiocystis violacea]MBK1720023.1 AMP-dependent synthetase [Thiocystis violacea]